MAKRFENETSVQNYEWHRRRVLKEKAPRERSQWTNNRIEWNLRQVQKKHGAQAARELAREYRSR